MSRFTDYIIRPARRSDVARLAPDLREIDRREAWALGRLGPDEALRVSFERSSRVFSALTGAGDVILMWGVGPVGGLLGFTGLPWLLASPVLERPEVAREFIRQSRPCARALEEGFNRLVNRVHAHNSLAVRWLKWLGFSFAAEPETFNGEPFYLFWREC